MSGYHPIGPPQLRSTRIPSNIFYRIIIPAAIWILLISPSPCFSFDWPFNQDANWGGTGLMEIPNARISLGYLEKMYAGVGAECLYLIGDGRFALGIDGDYVIKREPERLFNLLDFKRDTLFLTGYYSYPPLDITVETKYGRFLAGDIGWKFDVSRRYTTGATVGFFYTITNTDAVKGYFNKGYHHKGVYIEIPARVFMKRDSVEMYEQRISPWTRDVGATVFDGVKLFKQIKDLLPSRFLERVNTLRE